ncbi:MAG: endo alpha-1,4 polygalactosaminidase [Thiobacillus sp.]
MRSSLLLCTRFFQALTCLISVCCLPAYAGASLSPAFYYGPSPFPQALRSFDTWIVEPDQQHDPALIAKQPDTFFAYVSVGEIHPDRAYFKSVPDAWLKAPNPAWGSRVIDQSAPGWPAFFVDRIVAPLRQQGYRHFFLDTLDSYHLIAATPESRKKQAQGVVEAIRLLKTRYPDARLILNRGFELLPEIAPLVEAVAAESLFGSWDNRKQTYGKVSASDRNWLKAELLKVRDTYRLPVIVIDYAASGGTARQDIARQIEAEGFIPWVSDGALASVGSGRATPMPRTILMLHDGVPSLDDVRFNTLHTQVAMPLNYLGYVPEYRAIQNALPTGDLSGRYAGIVTWLKQGDEPSGAYRTWLLAQIQRGIPVAVLGEFGFEIDPVVGKQLGLSARTPGKPGKVSIVMRKPEAAFEIEPLPHPESYFPLTANRAADIWLKLGDGTTTQDAVAVTSWGGYALGDNVTLRLPDSDFSRWVIDPFAFFTQALKLPPMPVPDVTTENGRRLLITHIDGDGFASRAEFAGSPWAADVLYREILTRYAFPTTVSVIEGEIGKTGLYPKLATQLEPIARRIFALPHVEAASHSYSHPFFWRKAAEAEGDSGSYHLEIRGYTFNNARELQGSVHYINSLLPPGKQCRVFLWTGDCRPDAAQLALLNTGDVLNMNGGETLISKADPSLTLAAPLGIPLGEDFQVYAPNQNENVYTNLWTGPFYGYERVIETFELTEKPRRLKPVNIYYHTYSASKPASLKALKKVYDWAARQPLFPVHASDYIRKVQDFNRIAIARDGDGWQVTGASVGQTLRLPARLGYPDLARSRGVLGWRDEGAVRYLHLGSGAALVAMNGQATQPRLERANTRLTITTEGWRFDGAAPLQAEFAHAHARACTFKINGKKIPVRQLSTTVALLTHPARKGTLEMRCGL